MTDAHIIRHPAKPAIFITFIAIFPFEQVAYLWLMRRIVPQNPIHIQCVRQITGR